MSRTSCQRRHCAPTARRSPACGVESLEGRQLFSAAPLAGAVAPCEPGQGDAGTIAMRKAGGQAESQSIIAILRSLAEGGTTVPSVQIIAI
jgi:hypothetical protein